MQFLMKGIDFFKAQQIYIYIYIWKADKGVMEIKFCNPMFACEESDKACEESGKALYENTSKPSLLENDFLEQDFCSSENGLLGYRKSPFQKESLEGQCQFLCF